MLAQDILADSQGTGAPGAAQLGPAEPRPAAADTGAGLLCEAGLRKSRVIAASAYVASALLPPLFLSLARDGEWWNGFGMEDDLRGPNEYEACEWVRREAFVHAPANAWSFYAGLAGPVHLILRGRWWTVVVQAATGRPSAGHRSHTGPLVCLWAATWSAVLAFNVCASFCWHASTKKQVLWADVRAMILTAGYTVITLAYTHGPPPRGRGPAGSVRRVPALLTCMAATAWILAASTTNVLQHSFVIVLVAAAVAQTALCATHMRRPGTGPASKRRMRWVLALTTVGYVAKGLDSWRVACSPKSVLQGTAFYHVAMGLAFALALADQLEVLEGMGASGAREA